MRILFSVVAGLAVLSLSACDQSPVTPSASELKQPRPARIVPLSQSAGGVQRTYPGTLEASQKADLAFRVGGQMIELPAQAGLRVKKGDLLAKLDPADYRNALAERQARFDLAKTQLQQTKALRKKNLASQANYDQANAELKSASAALQQARDNLAYTALRAPFDGLVARVSIENFQPVQAKTTVVQLRTEDALTIRFSVPESLLARLKQVEDERVIKAFCGQVRFVTHPEREFRACHHKHETVPDPLTRNYAAWFALDQIDDFVVLPGMTATIALDFSPFLADQAERKLYAPVEAVFAEAGQRWVWRVDQQMQARKQQVDVGRIEGDRIEITSEIDPNTQVIAAGVSYVREGMKVKPLIKQRGL